MEQLDWQTRDPSTSVLVHMLAGTLAGITQHISMMPIDNVKTHSQVENSSIFSIIKKIYKSGGIKNFYAGSSIVVAGCGPAHAIYFSIYEWAKDFLECKGEDFGKFAIVGAMSAMFHDIIMNPTQALKQRVQLLHDNNSNVSIIKVAKDMYRKQGMSAFYRSFPVSYIMNIPFGSLMILANQKLKHLFNIKQTDHGINYYICGALAGGITSIPCAPLDVIRTKLNTQNCIHKNRGRHAVRYFIKSKMQVVHDEGQNKGKEHKEHGKEHNGYLKEQDITKHKSQGDISKHKGEPRGVAELHQDEGSQGLRETHRGRHSKHAWDSHKENTNYKSSQSLHKNTQNNHGKHNNHYSHNNHQNHTSNNAQNSNLHGHNNHHNHHTRHSIHGLGHDSQNLSQKSSAHNGHHNEHNHHSHHNTHSGHSNHHNNTHSGHHGHNHGSDHHGHSRVLYTKQQMKFTKIKYHNLMDTTKTIWKQEGLHGFFRGSGVRMLIQSLSSGVSWGSYQLYKNSLSKCKF